MISIRRTIWIPLRGMDRFVDSIGGKSTRAVWAVTHHTIAEAFRMKLGVFFVVLLGLGLAWAASGEGDGTVSGRIQATVTYSLTLAGLLLSLLSIFLAKSLSDELAERQILMLMSKPLPRWQLILGKWLGIVLLDAMLLTATALGLYGTVMLVAEQPPLNEYDAGKLEHEVLVARHSSPFVVPDFSREVEALYEQRLSEGAYDQIDDPDPKRIKADLRMYIEARWRNVPTYDYRIFRFDNVLCDRSPDSMIQVRYKCKTNWYPPDEVIRTLWTAGNPEQGTEMAQSKRRDVHGRYHNIPFPASTVGPDSTLYVRFDNINPFEGEEQFNLFMNFEGERGVEVLFPVGTFGGNLLRAMFLIQWRLMFLAAVGLLFATLFSFPVASLCSLSVFLLGSVRGFLEEAIGGLEPGGVTGLIAKIINWTLEAVYLLVPNLGAYSGVSNLADGRNVSLAWVLQGGVMLVLVGTTASLLLACIFFHRREVSETSI